MVSDYAIKFAIKASVPFMNTIARWSTVDHTGIKMLDFHVQYVADFLTNTSGQIE